VAQGADRADPSRWTVRWAFVAQVVGWTVLGGLILLWNRIEHQQTLTRLARSDARTAIEKDLLFRQWAAGHGGVYVPVTAGTPPNPYLSHLPERDLVTPSGRRLTLVNPAYMTRQVHSLAAERNGVKGHITSLNPIRPQNAPDAWERKALERFERGAREASDRVEIQGQSHLRLMRPLKVESGCLACHAQQGYRLGDLRGGISVTLPLGPYQAAGSRHERVVLLVFGLVWLFGLAGVILGYRSRHRQEQERQAAQEALAASEARFRLLYERSPVAYQSLDGEGRILEVNESWLEMLGYPRDEVLGQPVARYLDPSQVPLLQEQLPRLKAEGRISGVELTFRHRDGNEVVVSVEGRTDTDARGALVRTHCMLHDITERKHMEDALREQAALLDVSQDAIALLDVDGRIVFTNSGFARLFGQDEHETRGRTVRELWFPAGIPPALAEIRETVVSQGAWTAEIQVRARDGRQLTLDSRWWLVRDAKLAPRSILVVSTDVTERRALEAQVLRAQRLESLGVLASGVAHDLNNVLAPIAMAASSLSEFVSNQEGLELLETVESSAAHGASVVRQILAFARGSAGERGPLQPRHVVRMTEQLLRETFPKSIHIEVRLDSDLWTLLGDATQVQQLLMSLCVNARDAMPTGGTLTLSGKNARLAQGLPAALPALRPGDYVSLTVADTGTGIAEKVQARMFEPFFSTKSEGQGTGLGLSTALGIVKGHEGGLQVETEPGAGCRFTVYLPVAPETARPDRVSHSLPRPARREGVVLIVDDESFICRMATMGLQLYGYEVLSAANGQEALAIFEQQRQRISVVVSDYSMPVMDGPTLIAALRAQAPDLPIVLTSGLAETLTPEETLSLKVSAVLVKPFTIPTLLQAIEAQLHRPAD
jgi:PAS domain S-box-containing protein